MDEHGRHHWFTHEVRQEAFSIIMRDNKNQGFMRLHYFLCLDLFLVSQFYRSTWFKSRTGVNSMNIVVLLWSDHFAWKKQGWIISALYILIHIQTLTSVKKKKNLICFLSIISKLTEILFESLKTSPKNEREHIPNMNPGCRIPLCCSAGPPEAQHWSMAAEENLSLLLCRT